MLSIILQSYISYKPHLGLNRAKGVSDQVESGQELMLSV